MEMGLYFMKFLLITCNVCMWLFGAACLGVSIWLFEDEDFRNFRDGMDVEYLYTGCIVIIVVSLIILIISLLGCIGAATESPCMLLSYFLVILITLIVEFAAAGIIWSNASNIKEWVDDQVTSKIHNYYSGSENHRLMVDFMQYYLECCGSLSYRDYDQTKLPGSCRDSVTGIASSYGCLEIGEYYFERKSALFGGLVLSLALFQILTLVLSMGLFLNARKAAKY